MKNVRIFFTKSDRMRFVSHLDMNRFMSRMLRKTNIPIWFTEGFHPHPYITFALPLSLGFESEYEILDIRITDDDYPLNNVLSELNSVFPPYVNAFKAAEPVKKPGSISFADFSVSFFDSGNIKDDFTDFLNSDSIITEKTTKKGLKKEIDIAPKIKKFELTLTDGTNTLLNVTLPAGSEDNINPELLINAFFDKFPDSVCNYKIVRKMIYDKNMEIFT